MNTYEKQTSIYRKATNIYIQETYDHEQTEHRCEIHVLGIRMSLHGSPYVLCCCRAALQTKNNRFVTPFLWIPMNSNTFPYVLGCCRAAIQIKSNRCVIPFRWIPMSSNTFPDLLGCCRTCARVHVASRSTDVGGPLKNHKQKAKRTKATGDPLSIPASNFTNLKNQLRGSGSPEVFWCW